MNNNRGPFLKLNRPPTDIHIVAFETNVDATKVLVHARDADRAHTAIHKQPTHTQRH